MNIDIPSIPVCHTDKYFLCLIALARADNHLSNAEIEYIRMQSLLYRFDIESILGSDIDLEELDFSSLDTVTKISILRDLIVLANIDGEYSVVGKKKIEVAASLMGVGLAKLEEIHAWLVEYWDILRKLSLVYET